MSQSLIAGQPAAVDPSPLNWVYLEPPEICGVSPEDEPDGAAEGADDGAADDDAGAEH